ncbi:hypothetical protein LTR02_017854 [Friedmanniomyces endolithicus]|nr:hypothetical protein LTR38_017890 [Friedmanniomyces endolithicus]KAK5144564.1 hypothetical protein LTR32_003538 [Rachicladosporium monterosium]KAK0770052.1 hypothetical protein LTR59_016702 [Friedmanniomyces endolithicus]KAK0824061.1 hypothetical protein LTR03_017820 [Friedmanniomyces endolithicus]KAK0838585.1 hypothetical protein LTS02_017714 [Friedmanniomyces endolithicus]
MPYTTLQYLNILAQYNKWQRMYAYPLHRGDSHSETCRLRAVEAETTRTEGIDHAVEIFDGEGWTTGVEVDETAAMAMRERQRNRKRKIIIFKRTGPGSSMNWYAGVNPPCGLLECRVCGLFLEMMIEHVEKACPALASGEDD